VTAPADTDQPLRAAIVPVTPLQQNCAIVWCTTTMRGVVVDPGGDVARIREGLEQTGVEVECILLTHGHIDHAGGAAELAEALSVEIVGPQREDKFLLDSLDVSGAEFGIRARPCTPDRWLEENDIQHRQRRLRGAALPRPQPGPHRAGEPGAEFRHLRRRAVSRLDRAHRSAARRP
jgi:hydroxyacylglutathione hydrolase